MKNKLRFAFITTTIFATILLFSAQEARAQASRTWVSGNGDDANPCSRTAPCKTFAGAISKTAAGGTISALDPSGYGAVTINKSLTIEGTGTLASVLFTGGNGITVTGAGIVVTLRNLSIDGVGTGTSGIRFTQGAELHVENCYITGFTTSGIDASLASSAILAIRDSTITSQTTSNANGTGINVTTTSGTIRTSIDNVRIQGLGVGINAAANSSINVSDSVISQSSSAGINAAGNGLATVSSSVISQNTTNGIIADDTGVINVESCVISQNGVGVLANTGATIRLSNAQIFNNTTGIGSGGGAVVSFNNNKIAGNATQGAPTAYLANQ